MELTKHCMLCDHQLIDPRLGTFCDVSNRKPDFSLICPTIQLTEKFETSLKDTNINFEKVRKTKGEAIFNFLVYNVFGIAVGIAGYLIGIRAFDAGVLSIAPLIIMCIGLSLIALGIGSIVIFNREMKMAKTKKKNIDDVLNLYGIVYGIDFKFGRNYHGIQEVTATLNLTRPKHSQTY